MSEPTTFKKLRTTSPSQPTARVLIVEDDSLWRRMLRHTLEKHNVVLTEVTSIAEAVAAIGEQSFDLVLIDYDLPDGCGLDLLTLTDRARLGRVVLASGFVDSHDLNDDRCDEVARFLTKPFHSAELVACLDGLFRFDSKLGKAELVG